MPDLVLLCSGAAADLAPVDARADALRADATAIAKTHSAGAFARAFAHGGTVADASDDAVRPRELPEETWLRARFGVPDGDAIEAWSARHDGVALPAWRATPVHVAVGHYQLLLADPSALSLADAHARALADAARPVLADAGFSLSVASPMHWYLAGHDDWALDTHAWPVAVGRNIDGFLPTGRHARDWRRVFTDVQIAWHDHAANAEREAQRLPAVNALWLDGRARGPLAAQRATVVTHDAAIAGLAAGAGCRVDDAPLDALTPARFDATGDVLVDVDFWRAARRAGDPGGWLDGWARFDRWLAGTGLDRGAPRGFARLRAVLSGERRCVELATGRGAPWRFWRRFDAVSATLVVPRAAAPGRAPGHAP